MLSFMVLEEGCKKAFPMTLIGIFTGQLQIILAMTYDYKELFIDSPFFTYLSNYSTLFIINYRNEESHK